MHALVLLLSLAQALWGSTCTGRVCTFDGSASTGAIASYTWSWGDSTPTSKGKIVGHTFAQPGTYAVKLVVYDPTTKKYSQLSRKITVSDAAPVIHDTIRVAIHDTVRVQLPPFPPVHDTVLRTITDTLVRHDTAALALPAFDQPGGVLVDSAGGGRPWRVWRVTWLGNIDPKDRHFHTYPALVQTPQAGLLTIYVSQPRSGIFATLDAAVAKLVGP